MYLELKDISVGFAYYPWVIITAYLEIFYLQSAAILNIA